MEKRSVTNLTCTYMRISGFSPTNHLADSLRFPLEDSTLSTREDTSCVSTTTKMLSCDPLDLILDNLDRIRKRVPFDSWSDSVVKFEESVNSET